MFYERYVSLCTREKISPSTAAVKAGFNKGTVSVWKKKYEAGQDVVPEQEIIDKICAFFGCSESWLRGIEKAPTPEGEREISFDDFTYAFYELLKFSKKKSAGISALSRLLLLTVLLTRY